MVDSVGAKGFYNWIVEPDSDNTTFNARKIKQNTEQVTNYSDPLVMFKDINTDLVNGAGKKGGRIGVRNGTYLLSPLTTDVVGLQFGHSTTQTGATIIIEGETRDGVIFKENTAQTDSAASFIGTICNLEVRNLTIDVNSKGATQNITCLRALADGHGSPLGFMNAFNCKFTNHTGFGFRMGESENWRSCIVQDCEFIQSADSQDQCSIHPQVFGLIDGNYLNTTSTLNSSITPGQGQNIEICNNTIVRTTADIFSGISLEPFSGTSANYYIHDNILNTAALRVGQSGAWVGTIRNVTIDNNTVSGGEIQIFGPTSGAYDTQIKNIWLTNNKHLYPAQAGIIVNHVADFVVVKNNTVIDSNINLTDPASTSNTGLMRLANSTHVVAEDNTLYMGVTSPDNAWYSNYGIRLENLINSKVQNNRIINATTANSSYQSSGTHTGSKISQTV